MTDTNAPLSDADLARLAVEGCSYPDEREVTWLALECRRLRAEEKRLDRVVAGLRDQIEREGCAASHLGELTYECDATKPCGLCRLRGERDRLRAENAALRADLGDALDGWDSDHEEATGFTPRVDPQSAAIRARHGL